MKFSSRLIEATPQPMKKVLAPLINPVLRFFVNKYDEEVSFWDSRLKIDNGVFHNHHYEKLMLAMAEEPDDNFLKEKIVADFGCGPRGSLVWAKSAAVRIGIDVLADHYADRYTDNFYSHDMIYLKSTEKVVPLPSDFVDVVFTVNAMDHVNDFQQSCKEILRILKPGGDFIGSFNINHPATNTEPQSIDEDIIEHNLLKYLKKRSYRLSQPGPAENYYSHFFEGTTNYMKGEEGILWVKYKKPSYPAPEK